MGAQILNRHLTESIFRRREGGRWAGSGGAGGEFSFKAEAGSGAGVFLIARAFEKIAPTEVGGALKKNPGESVFSLNWARRRMPAGIRFTTLSWHGTR